MKHYQDVTLLPDTEASLGFLWQKVYLQVHIALVDNKIAENESAIAVSFPGYGEKKFPLGNKLRLIAKHQDQIKQLNIEEWLSRLTDYTHIKSIQDVPNNSIQACFKRKSVKSEMSKAERLAKHLNKPVDEILKYRKENNIARSCKLPYIHMESQKPTSNGHKHKFHLFIEKTESDIPVAGTFDCYGLSKTATVPWF